MEDKRVYLAGLAMQALIAKMPLLDNEGTIGVLKTDKELQTVKKQLAKSAWAYSDWMLSTEQRIK